jgi:hypothetical protein
MMTDDCSKSESSCLSSMPRGVICSTTAPYIDRNSRPMTYGEKMVGFTFNPSGDKKVEKIKRLFAEVLDLLQEKNTCQLTSMNEAKLKDSAVSEIISAQMWAVKYITYKD